MRFYEAAAAASRGHHQQLTVDGTKPAAVVGYVAGSDQVHHGGHREAQRSSSYGETLNAEDDEVHVYDHFRTFDNSLKAAEVGTSGSKARDHSVHFSIPPDQRHRVFGDSDIFLHVEQDTSFPDDLDDAKSSEVSKSFYSPQPPPPPPPPPPPLQHLSSRTSSGTL